ncbi:ABC transporter permease [Mesoplasma melaleucae]|uniref:Uncharacterized protein n=1 Tax=Mesoplasma melaleucae TaxID=81459 RepID=A0A2K8NX97_9MOLU|nr:ABC transporter permease [Mesoplasma melaleucae]ATZ18166.1 hypothetical protein EMELA_v1c06590 [Mesoplasma melaleucae]
MDKVNYNQSFKTSTNNFSKIFRASFISSIKNERAWVFIILGSLIITIICFIGYSTFYSSYELLPPQMLAIFIIPSFVSATYFVIFLIEWKDTSLLKRIKFLGIKKWSIVFSFMLCAAFFTFVSEIIVIFATYLISLLFIRVKFYYILDLNWWMWIWFFGVSFICVSSAFLLSSTISDLFKSKNIRMSVPLILFLLFLTMSDTVIPSFISARWGIFNYLGYLFISKYVVWSLLIVSSYTFIDFKGGIQQIIFDESHSETTLFISNLWILLAISVLFIIVMCYLSVKFFKWK